MKTHKTLSLVILIALTFTTFLSCERNVDEEIEDEIEIGTEENEGDEINEVGNIEDHDDVEDYIWNASDVIPIILEGDAISCSSDNVTIDGGIATIQTAGTYNISGTLNNGQIIVNTSDNTIVRLILDNADISCSNNSPLYVMSAEKTMVVLAENTENSLSDGSSYSSDETDANAALFSKDDLTIYGDGSLNVNGNYQDGITSKDGLIIASGTINVNAIDDGIRGKDYLVVNNGNIMVSAKGDGIKSDNDEDAAKGFIIINDGIFDVTADGDAIVAETDIIINYGDISVTSGGGSSANLSADVSAKGIKSGVSTFIYSGTINVDAADDGIHSDGDMGFYGATLNVASGDDGIHSEYDSEYTAGFINITDSYEGLESALGNIIISGGTFDIIASDDGINVSAGGGSSDGGPGGRKSGTTVTSDYALLISGGYIFMNCEGDGLDSNDLLDISGGTQLVNSAANNENSALDYDGSCLVSGGLLVAVGVKQMAKAPSSSSTQYSVMVNFSSTLAAGTLIHFQNTKGTSLLTYETLKSAESIVFSSADLENNTTYEVYYGGSSTGTTVNGLISDGTYSGGTKYTDFTISSMVTTID